MFQRLFPATALCTVALCAGACATGGEPSDNDTTEPEATHLVADTGTDTATDHEAAATDAPGSEGNQGTETAPAQTGDTTTSAQVDLTGVWQGTIDGAPPHFSETGQFALTLTFAKTETGYEGVVDCDDPGFSDDPITNVQIDGNAVTFDVVQSYFSDETVQFSATLSDDTLSGTWNHRNLHTGTWTASR